MENPISLKPLNVWIAGAGYLGRALAERLQAHAAFTVCASSRRLQDAVWWRHWDFNQCEVWHDFQDAEVWVLLLPPSCSDDYLAKMQTLCRLAQHHHIAHIVYASSTSVYGDAARWCDETSPTAAVTTAAKRMVAAETLRLGSGLSHISILRLGGLYDDERHPVYRLSGKTDLAGGQHRVNLVSKTHALMALEDCLTHSWAPIINVVERTAISRAEFYQSAARRLGLAPPHFAAADDSAGKIVTSRYGYWHF